MITVYVKVSLYKFEGEFFELEGECMFRGGVSIRGMQWVYAWRF